MAWDTIANVAAFVTLALAGLGALVGTLIVRKSRSTTEIIDGDVLSEFRQVLERVVKLELQLNAAWLRIDEMETAESNLIEKVSRREERILLLERENIRLKDRVAHLEKVCRAAGINGDLDENPT